MKKARLIQAGLIAVLVLAALVAWLRIREAKKGDSLVTWMPTEVAVQKIKEREAARNDRQEKSEQIKDEKKSEETVEPVIKCVPVELLDPSWMKPAEEKAPEPAEEKKPEPTWPDMGPQVVRAIKNTIEAELEQHPWGYTANDLVIGKILDNGSNRQRGEIEAAREYYSLIYQKVKPKGGVVSAANSNLLEGDLEKFWFPKAESTLDAALASLDGVAEGMKAGRIKAPGNPDTAREFVSLSMYLIEAEMASLTNLNSDKDGDDRFYHARGTTRVVKNVVVALPEAFPAAVNSKPMMLRLEDAEERLSASLSMDPFIVLQGDPDDFRSNHLFIMAYILGQAREALEDVWIKLGEPAAE